MSLEGEDLYDPDVDPVSVRRRIGMVFQRPNPFPTMSIHDNVAAGYRLNARVGRSRLGRVVEESLEAARVAQRTAFLLAEAGGPGRLIEVGPTGQLFTRPQDPRTEAYITGRFG